MRIAGVIFDAVNAYDGIAVEIYVSGCTRNCPGCHSPELQSFMVGGEWNDIKEQVIEDIDNESYFIDIISIIGGDLLCQPEEEAREFVADLKKHFPDKKYWLFTGAEREEVPQWVFNEFDVIKVGRYDETQRQEGFPSSKNQKLLYKGVDY